MKIKILSIFITTIISLLISNPVWGETNQIYHENFNSGINLEQLGFSEAEHSNWVLDRKNDCLTISSRNNQRITPIMTRSFNVNRDMGTVTLEWRWKYSNQFNRNYAFQFANIITAENDQPLYGLRIRPESRRGALELTLEKYQDQKPVILGKKTIEKKWSGQWLTFRIEFNPTSEFGGDGRIEVYADFNDGNGGICYLKVQDETYAWFSRLQLWFEDSHRSQNTMLAVDDIKVTENAQKNLLENSGFEKELDGWTADRGWDTVSQEKFNGMKSAIIDLSRGTADLTQGKNYEQSIAGTIFNGTAWVKTKNVEDLQFKLIWKNSANQWISKKQRKIAIKGTTDWTRLNISGTAPIGATQVWLKIEASGRRGRVLVDDVCLRRLPNLNLIKNNHFNEGLNHWEKTADWTVSKESYQQSKAAQCQIPFNGKSFLRQGYDYRRDISGLEFTASGWFKSPTASKVKMEVRWKDAKGRWIKDDNGLVSFEAPSEWQRYQLFCLAPAGATQIYLEISPESGATGEFLVSRLALKERVRPNLLDNPDFEEGIKDWIISGKYTFNEDPRFGNRSLVISPLKGLSQLAQGCNYQRDLKGVSFIASVWVKADKDSKVDIALNWKDAKGKWLNKNNASLMVKGKREWEKVYIRGIAPKGASQVWLVISPQNGRKPNVVEINDCTLSPCETAGFNNRKSQNMNTLQFIPEFNLPGSIGKCEWDFNNDGHYESFIEKPEYTFPGSGRYPINLNIYDDTGALYQVRRVIDVIGTNQLSLTWTVTEGFKVETAGGNPGEIANIVWDFGDGTILTSADKNIVHAYQKAGHYQVTATVTEFSGSTTTMKLEIDAPSSITANPAVKISSGSNGVVEAVFDAAATVHYGGSIQQITWDFGDGSSAEGLTANHTYLNPGSFYPKITILDSFNHLYTYELPAIKVENPINIRLGLNDGEVCRGYFNIQGEVRYNGEIQSIVIYVDGVEKTVISGSKEIAYELDTYLLNNGEHLVEVRVKVNGKETIFTKNIEVNNPVYRIMIRSI